MVFSPSRPRGFTLIELLVALSVMALLALLSWRGLDGMARAQTGMRERMDGIAGLQNGLGQWSADLDAVMETAQVNPIDYDGTVLRLTRRDTSSEGSPLRVVGWALVAGSRAGSSGDWARWQSLPLHTRSDLQQAWTQVQRWARNSGDADRSRAVSIAGLDQWQIFYYRNGAWSNPLSTASSRDAVAPASPGPGVSPGATAVTAIAPLPDGIRLVLTLSAAQPLKGVLVKDWIRPTFGGGKS